MKNKKLWISCAVAAIALIAGVTWWTMRGDNADCARALPADVTMVGRVNVSGLATQNGIELNKIQELLSDENREMGIDFLNNSYLFSSQGYLGAIIPLTDADAFADYLSSKGATIENQRGMKWVVLENNILVCIDDEKTMAMGPATGGELDALRNTLAACMKQKSGKSGMQSSQYQALLLREEPVAMVTNLGIIPENYTKQLKALLPKGVNRQDITLSSGVVFQGNELSLKMNLSSDSPTAQSFLAELDEVLCTLQGTLVDQTPNHPAICVNAGVKGEKLLGLLRKNPETRTKLLAINMGMDLDMMIKSVEGDVSVTVPTYGQSKLHGIFQAHVKEHKFMENVGDWNEGVSQEFGLYFLPARNDGYLCSWHDNAFYFGVRDKVLTLATNEPLWLSLNSEGEGMAHLADNLKTNKVYAVIDLTQMKQVMQFLPAVLPGELPELLFEAQRLTLSATTAQDWTLTLTTPEGTDLLNAIVK